MNESAKQNVFYYKEGKTSPKLLGYILSGLSITIGILLIIGISLCASYGRRLLAFEEFKAGLRSSNFSAAEGDFKKAVKPPYLFESLVLALYPAAASSTLYYERDLLTRLFDLNQSLRRRHYKQARRLLESESAFFTRKGTDQVRNAVTVLAIKLDGLAAEEKVRDQLEQQLELIQVKGRELQQRYGLIAEDFAEIFSLPAVKSQDEFKLPIYENGILQDLPVLKGIPDGIADLQQLNDSVVASNGRVQRGIRTARDLLEAIDGLRLPTQELQRSMAAELSSYQELDSQRKEVLARLNSQHTELLQISNEALSTHNFGSRSSLRYLEPLILKLKNG